VRSERSELTAKELILFSFHTANRSMYPSLYLTLYPRAEPLEQSSILAHLLSIDDRLCLRMSPKPSKPNLWLVIARGERRGSVSMGILPKSALPCSASQQRRASPGSTASMPRPRSRPSLPQRARAG
jgi:hypothetical protein